MNLLWLKLIRVIEYWKRVWLLSNQWFAPPRLGSYQTGGDADIEVIIEVRGFEIKFFFFRVNPLIYMVSCITSVLSFTSSTSPWYYNGLKKNINNIKQTKLEVKLFNNYLSRSKLTFTVAKNCKLNLFMSYRFFINVLFIVIAIWFIGMIDILQESSETRKNMGPWLSTAYISQIHVQLMLPRNKYYRLHAHVNGMSSSN